MAVSVTSGSDSLSDVGDLRRLGTTPARSADDGGFRPEIEGLRAIAATLVAVFHIWLGRVSGGVDVFFVVSGFLITTTLLGQVERTGRVRFAAFWGRLVRRLVPAAFLVLFVIMLASLWLMPKSEWRDDILDVAASATYLENWLLASRSVDYLAHHDVASPTQHFWALSVQGQFYFAWPVLITICAVVARRSGVALRYFAASAIGLVFAGSLAYSVYITHVDQPYAYFNSFARVWEFSLGALLAITLPALRLAGPLRVLAGWIGILAILSCGLLIQVSRVFPGYAALWPALAAVLVIAGGSSGSRFGVDRWLGSRPMVYLGGISYCVYLWHFPLLVFCRQYFQPQHLGFTTGLGIVVASFLLAAATHRWIEQPVRNTGQTKIAVWRSYALGAACAVPLVIALALWSLHFRDLKQRADVDGVASDPSYPGAAALEPGFVYRGAAGVPVYPGPFAVDRDREHADSHHCRPDSSDAELTACSYGAPDAPIRIAVVGGSHSAHWLPALVDLSERYPWKIMPFTRSNCPFQAGAVEVGLVGNVEHEACRAWNADVLSWLIREGPDFVFTTATRYTNDGENVPQSYIEQWARVVQNGVPIVAVRDNPSMGFDVSACVERHGADSPFCSRPRSEALAVPDASNRIASPPPGVQFIDMSDFFCDRTRCYPVVGNILLYRHGDHITSSYSHTLAPMLERELLRVFEQTSVERTNR